jgi:hypothetical protein
MTGNEKVGLTLHLAIDNSGVTVPGTFLMKRGVGYETRLALCALSIGLISTIATGQQVSVNYNHSQSFSQFHTYAWGSNNANQIQNSILAQVAQQDINSALQGKGWQIVQENQNPDVLLTASGGMREQTSYSAWACAGLAWAWEVSPRSKMLSGH